MFTAGRAAVAVPQVLLGVPSINLWPQQNTPDQFESISFESDGSFTLLAETPRLCIATIIHDGDQMAQGVVYIEPGIEYTVSVEDPNTGLHCGFAITYYLPTTAFSTTGG